MSVNNETGAETAERCRRCQHWQPLFTGEAWGVRSFADAPEHERAAILQRLADFEAREGYVDPQEAMDYSEAVSDRASWLTTNSDWPMWGECALTDLHDGAGSLARAIDGSRYMAILRCHADFGCVQFKPERVTNG